MNWPLLLLVALVLLVTYLLGMYLPRLDGAIVRIVAMVAIVVGCLLIVTLLLVLAGILSFGGFLATLAGAHSFNGLFPGMLVPCNIQEGTQYLGYILFGLVGAIAGLMMLACLPIGTVFMTIGGVRELSRGQCDWLKNGVLALAYGLLGMLVFVICVQIVAAFGRCAI